MPPGLDQDRLDLTMEPAPGLVMEVSLASGGRPDLVTLALLDAAGRTTFFVSRNPSEDGRFHFPSAPPGAWSALLQAPGTATASLPLQVPAEPVSVHLSPGGEVQVRVDELLTSPALATARLLAADGTPLRTLTSNGGVRDRWPVERGVAHLEAVPPGLWTLQVVTAQGAAWAGALSVPSGQTARILCQSGRCTMAAPP